MVLMWFAFASCWSFDIARALMAIFLPLATISARFLHWINASFHCESGVSSKGAQGSGAWVNLSYQADCAQVYRYMHKRSHAHRTARPSRSQFPGDQSGCERREVRGGSMVQHGRVGADAHCSKEWKTGGCGRAVVIYRDLYAQ